MDTYSALRHFADSWALAAMTAFYVGTVLWVFRPGARKAHDEAADIVFRNENAPAPAWDDAAKPDNAAKGNA